MPAVVLQSCRVGPVYNPDGTVRQGVDVTYRVERFTLVDTNADNSLDSPIYARPITAQTDSGGELVIDLPRGATVYFSVPDIGVFEAPLKIPNTGVIEVNVLARIAAL